MEREALIILPPELAPVSGPKRLHETPYGVVRNETGSCCAPKDLMHGP